MTAKDAKMQKAEANIAAIIRQATIAQLQGREGMGDLSKLEVGVSVQDGHFLVRLEHLPPEAYRHMVEPELTSRGASVLGASFSINLSHAFSGLGIHANMGPTHLGVVEPKEGIKADQPPAGAVVIRMQPPSKEFERYTSELATAGNLEQYTAIGKKYAGVKMQSDPPSDYDRKFVQYMVAGAAALPDLALELGSMQLGGAKRALPEKTRS